MKRIILCLSLFAFFGSQAQQINPVPDYVFFNKMSVGRNAVTDTAAYFSIGPRYGAIRGFMPPMVTDTATITTGKRNGLTIFSIQKNKYMYWDSVRVQWSDFAGSSGAYIFATDTASMLSPYIRHAGNGLTKTGQALSVDTAAIATRARVQKGIDSLGAVKGSGTVTSVSAGTGMSFTTITTTGSVAVDTLTLSTRAWRQKGLDSLAALEVSGSGTTNYVAKFTASGTVGNSILQDDGTRLFTGASTTVGNLFLGTSTYSTVSGYKFLVLSNTTGAVVSFAINGTEQAAIALNGSTSFNIAASTNIPMGFFTNSNERMRVTGDGELLINTTTDVGDYRLQVNGNANFRDDVQIDTNLRVNRHISLDQTPKAWALGNAIEGPQGSTLFVAGGGVQTLANIYYDGSYKYSTSNPGAAMFLLQSGITFATYGSGTANGALTGANEMVYAGGELRVGLADQGTFKLQVADKSYFGDEVQIASTTDLGNYKLQVTGEAIITAGIRTDAPSGGTAATWKLGTVATVSPTSPNRTIEVEIGGTTYYIHAKTTND